MMAVLDGQSLKKNAYEEKLSHFLALHTSRAEHLIFDQSCHSVEDACAAVGATVEDFVKNICMLDESGALIVAIVKGEDRASTSRVAKALKSARPRLANPEEILAKTGFPCGGTPSFGYEAKFLVDPRVLDRPIIYTGGGSERSLVKIDSGGILQLNAGEVLRVRK